MKTGKVSDTILSRAVLKPVNAVRGRNITRIDIGQDAGEVKLISGVIEAVKQRIQKLILIFLLQQQVAICLL